MTSHRFAWAFGLLFAICATAPAQQASAQGDPLRGTLFPAADAALAAARAVNAQELAPETFARALAAYESAESNLARGRNMDRIRNELATATNAFNAATEAAEIANIRLASLLKTRADAENADADTFAAEQWTEGTELFAAAARRLEAGDIRGAGGRAEEAEALFRDAELTAIKAQYLSQTRALLAQAEQLRVQRTAPITLAKAQALLEQAERELSNNRYDTDMPRSLAQQANYQARHAIYLARLIESIDDEDRTLEEVILTYEEPLAQIGAAADLAVQLDRGVEPAAVEIASYIEALRERADQTDNDLDASRTRVAELEEEIRDLDEQLGGVSQERVALVQRLEAENRLREQFATVEGMFTREEARVSREGNRIVLRLVGLTFPSAQADVGANHRALLDKVRRAAAVFPNSQIVIEGHTDSYGGDEANMALSRRRAEAVSAYLATELGVPAVRLSAVGYGETQPIANNETPQGRERNRRIDVLIEPQLGSAGGN
jgi:outer membrane protein OmpA-like peptidoglycan-associated protein